MREDRGSLGEQSDSGGWRSQLVELGVGFRAIPSSSLVNW